MKTNRSRVESFLLLGYPPKQIAAKLGVDTSTIYKIRKELGLVRTYERPNKVVQKV